MARAREISALLLEQFDRGDLQKIFVVYTDMESGVSFQARSTRSFTVRKMLLISPRRASK